MKNHYSRTIRNLLAALFLFVPLQVWAACSPYIGLAVINEVSKEQQNPTNKDSGDSELDFVEVKMLDSSIPASTYQNWTIEICENSGDGCSTVSLSTADGAGYPWLVMTGLETVGRHLNLALGTYIYLYDENGDVVDYLSAGGYNASPLPSCSFLYDTTANTDSQTRRIQRMPDGTGDWEEPPGNSSPPTDSSTNDDNVPADAPNLTINDVSVAAGNDLVFTLTLSAAYSADVTVNYQTYDNTAIAGIDYVAASGTATIPAGNTTTTVTVSSLAGGGGSFYLLLSSATNAIITDQLGKGLIIPDPLAEWRFDEYGWTGAAGEVLDSSANGLHGTASGAGTTDTSPAIAGSPGTCYYGEFDGVDDYVSVDDNTLLDLTGELTIAAWVRPQTGTTGIDTILSKGGAGDFSYALRLTANQNLEFTWCTASAGSCSSSETVVSVGTLPLDQWSHVAISFSSTVQRLYINGSQDGVATLTTSIAANDGPLYIGSAAGADQLLGAVDEVPLYDPALGEPLSGAIDEVRLYDHALGGPLIGAIMNQTRVCTPAVFDHYHISFDGGVTASDASAITCEAATVTITAHAAGHLGTVIPAAGSSIDLSTTTGAGYWSLPSSGSVVDNGGGNATYTFDGSQQSISLQFNHTVPAINPNPVNINIDGGTGEDTAEDPNLQFFESGFRFVDGLGVASIGNQVAAQESATHYLQAIRTDLQTGACVGVFADGQQVDVQLGAECNNPSTCAGLQVNLTNNATTTALATSADNANTGAAAYGVANLLFGPDSMAAFTLNYADVGAISLHARHQLRNEDGTLSSDFMLGSSNSFVVAPASLAITAITTTAGVANPGTTSAAPGFTAAGTPFRVVVQARNALGNLTPNYGNETAPEGVRIHLDSLVFPVGATNGALLAPSAFSPTASAGEFENSSIAFTEAGSITVYASVADGDYLGAGNATSPVSGTVGRFYPAEFRLASSAVVNSCALGPFSYMSEPGISVSYQVEAHRSGGGVLLNYDSTDLNYPTASYSLHAESNNDGNDLSARLFAAGATWNDGALSVNDPAANFARAAGPDGPFPNTAVGIRVVDLDAADFDTLDFRADATGDCTALGDCDARLLSGALDARFGRMYLQDAHGPESSPIPMVWQTEYWNGESFVINTDDHCTEIPLASVDFVGATTTVDDVNDAIQVDIGGVVSIFDFSDPLGSSDCLSSTDVRVCDGRAGLAYGAPGAIVTYPISVDLTGLPWLQGDWNLDGSYTDNPFPLVNIRFQHYRGHDRVIYWREVLD